MSVRVGRWSSLERTVAPQRFQRGTTLSLWAGSSHCQEIDKRVLERSGVSAFRDPADCVDHANGAAIHVYRQNDSQAARRPRRCRRPARETTPRRSVCEISPTAVSAVRTFQPCQRAHAESILDYMEMETLTGAIRRLRDVGFECEVTVGPNDLLSCGGCGALCEPGATEVDEIVRFEGVSDPGDAAALVALRFACGHGGLLVSAYGTYATAEHASAPRRLPAAGGRVLDAATRR
jgi:hypothetical protein